MTVVSALNHAQVLGDANVLVIGASLAGDSIMVTAVGKQTGSSTDTVKVTINGAFQGTYTGFSSIAIYGQGGNDHLSVSSLIRQNASLFGGNGDDVLRGGGGNNLLVGGDGNDTLISGPAQWPVSGSTSSPTGRNILIGGKGHDLLLGGGASGLLIGDSTDFDDPTNPAGEAGLTAIRNAWENPVGDYSARAAAVLALLSTNGTNAAHIHDDGAADVLVSGWGEDLFFVGKGDWLLGRRRGAKVFKSGTGLPG